MSSVTAPMASTSHALNELYRDHHHWLLNWLRRRTGDPSDAADLTQDTFIRLLTGQSAASLHELERPRAYLATVAQRLMLNLHRRRSLEQAYLDVLIDLPEEVTPSLEYQALVLEALHAVDEVLRRLPENTRRAFLMAQLEGYSHATIAERLGVNIRSVQRYLARAYEECIVLASLNPAAP